MRAKFTLLIIIAVVALVAALYFMALNMKPPGKSTLKSGSFAEYSFNVQPSGTNGTYKWEVLSVVASTATVMEQVNASFGLQNYTSYLNLETGVITRERTIANGTLQEPLCFMLTSRESIAECPYYAPLKITGNENFAERSGIRVVPENSISEYFIFDEKTGIMLTAQYSVEQTASVYKLIDTNVF